MARNRLGEYFQVITGMLLKYGRLNRYEVANILRLSPNYAGEIMRMYYHSEDVRREFDRLGLTLVYVNGVLRVSGESSFNTLSLSDYGEDGGKG